LFTFNLLLWCCSDEVVSGVKVQALVELQKAISVAESKAAEIVAAERVRMELVVLEVRKQAKQEALAVVDKQTDSTQVSHTLHYYLKRFQC